MESALNRRSERRGSSDVRLKAANADAFSMKIYCEHNAMSADIRRMLRDASVEIVHFPYDPDSQSRHVDVIATPSHAQFRDLNIPTKDLPGSWTDYSGSVHLEMIRSTLGPQHRRDALDVDSAFKSGCAAFITRDSDILDHKGQLESFLGIKFFHPEIDRDALQSFFSSERGAA